MNSRYVLPSRQYKAYEQNSPTLLPLQEVWGKHYLEYDKVIEEITALN